MNIRMFPPNDTRYQTIVANGRSYTGSPGSAYDILDADADVLGANGWVKISPSGPTSGRPGTSQVVDPNYFSRRGSRYFDTTLSKLIVFDGLTWRDPADGSAV